MSSNNKKRLGKKKKPLSLPSVESSWVQIKKE